MTQEEAKAAIVREFHAAQSETAINYGASLLCPSDDGKNSNSGPWGIPTNSFGVG